MLSSYFIFCNGLQLHVLRWLLALSEELGVILFASDQDIRVLTESEILVGDAAFKCAPRDFSQVYTLHGKVFIGDHCLFLVGARFPVSCCGILIESFFILV